MQNRNDGIDINNTTTTNNNNNNNDNLEAQLLNDNYNINNYPDDLDNSVDVNNVNNVNNIDNANNANNANNINNANNAINDEVQPLNIYDDDFFDDTRLVNNNPNNNPNNNLNNNLNNLNNDPNIALHRETEQRRRQEEQEEAENDRRLKAEEERIKKEKDALYYAEELKKKKKKKQTDEPKKEKKPKKKKAEDAGYEANDEIPDTLIHDQSDEVDSNFRLLKKLNTGGKYGAFTSKKYRKMWNDLGALDEFLKEIDGRTRLTADEMQTYDRLTLNVYNSSKEYMENKARERISDKETDIIVDGTYVKPKNSYESARMQHAQTIHDSVAKMREDMFKHQVKMKEQELNKKCQALLQEKQEERTNLIGKDDAAKEMGDNIATSLFLMNRVDSLRKQGDLKIKPGESIEKAMERLDKALTPTVEDLKHTKETELYKNITEKAMEDLKKGTILTTEDLMDMQKKSIQKEGEKKAQQNLKKEGMRPVTEPQKNNALTQDPAAITPK